MFDPQNILIPTDFSPNSEKAFRYAVDIAKRTNASLYLLHVNEIIKQCVLEYCLDNAIVQDLDRQTTASSKEMMKKIINRFPEAKGLKIKTDVKEGTPYEEILKEQESNKIDLIIIASHKGKNFFNHLLGGVAERVTRLAKCPVLVVKN